MAAITLQLLSRDGQGTSRASRVLQLRKMAEDSGNDRFTEGVRIIEEKLPAEHNAPLYTRPAQGSRDGGVGKYPVGITECEAHVGG